MTFSRVTGHGPEAEDAWSPASGRRVAAVSFIGSLSREACVDLAGQVDRGRVGGHPVGLVEDLLKGVRVHVREAIHERGDLVAQVLRQVVGEDHTTVGVHLGQAEDHDLLAQVGDLGGVDRAARVPVSEAHLGVAVVDRHQQGVVTRHGHLLQVVDVDAVVLEGEDGKLVAGGRRGVAERHRGARLDPGKRVHRDGAHTGVLLAGRGAVAVQERLAGRRVRGLDWLVLAVLVGVVREGHGRVRRRAEADVLQHGVRTVHVLGGSERARVGDRNLRLAGPDGLDGRLVILGDDALDGDAELLREVVGERGDRGDQVRDVLVRDQRERDLVGPVGPGGRGLGAGRSGGSVGGGVRVGVGATARECDEGRDGYTGGGERGAHGVRPFVWGRGPGGYPRRADRAAHD